MMPASTPLPDPSAGAAVDGSQRRTRLYTPGLSDGLGDRLLTFDNNTSTSLELLTFKQEFSEQPGFEAALRRRIDELARLRHPSIAPVRTVEWMGAGEGLALVSVHTAGRRLSELMQGARGAAFAMELIRQVAPALSAIQQAGSGLAHGVLTPERIVVTREGRLVIVEHVIGLAVESLGFPASRLRSELGLAVPAGSEAVRFDARRDVIQLGFIALSLLLGRRLDANEYPANVKTWLDEFAKADAPASAKLRSWLERALQVGGRPFGNAHEAYEAFTEVAEGPAPAPAPAPVPAAESARPVLAFHSPADATGNATPSADKASSGKKSADASKGKAVEAKDAPKGQETEPVQDAVVAPEQAMKRAGGSGGALKWGVGVAALLAVGAGVYMFGPFTKVEPPAVVVPPVAAAAEAEHPLPPPPVTDAHTGVASGPASAPQPTSAAVAPPPVAPAVEPPPSPRPTAAVTEPPPAPASSAPAAPSGRFGGVKVNSVIDLQVFENGNLLGSTAGPIAIGDGPHALELVNETLGFRFRQSVSVKPGQMTNVTIAVPNGRLSINAVPWAEVTIDGNAAGETPLANLSLPIGSHEIVFKHPQFGEQRQTVLVKAEGVTRVNATLQK